MMKLYYWIMGVYTSILILSLALVVRVFAQECSITDQEKHLIDQWIYQHNLTQYGDPQGVYYTTPGESLIDPKTGTAYDRYYYIACIKKYPRGIKPWKNLVDKTPEWQQTLARYLGQATPEDLALLMKYLGYYRSWYQAVRPAPVGLYESLSQSARHVIHDLQEYAQQFTRQPQPALPGSSRLTIEGEKFYQSVREELANSNAGIQACSRVMPQLTAYLDSAPSADIHLLARFLASEEDFLLREPALGPSGEFSDMVEEVAKRPELQQLVYHLRRTAQPLMEDAAHRAIESTKLTLDAQYYFACLRALVADRLSRLPA